MSEWLTTGQMIDRLKVGDIAEGNTHWEVKKISDGVVFDNIVELNSGNQIILSESFLKEKWRTLPKYVSFEEAMKALGEGKTVYLYNGGNCYEIEEDTDIVFLFDETLLSFGDLFKCNWMIEGETNE